MSWEKEVEELKRRQKLAEGMGGPEKLKRQKDGGKLNVRERIAGLVDKGSFREVGKLGGVGQYDAKGNLTSFLPEGWDGSPARRRSATASHFAAVLEMAKRGQIQLKQGDTFAPILIRKVDGA